MPSDAALRSDIEEELDFEPSLDASGIGVSVKEGVATLSGHVSSYAQKVAAERAVSRVEGIHSAELAVRRLGGVMGVINTIDIRPHATVNDVRAHITEAFRRNAELESSGITVLVEGGKITLSGRVKALHERRTVENSAWGISSVMEMVDNLIVA